MPTFPTTLKLFATPLLVDQVDDPGLLTALKEAILKRRDQDPGILRSNIGGGWHSDVRLPEWGGDAARRLLDHVIALVNDNTFNMNASDGRPIRWAIDCWANVNENGGANARHVHGGSFWSAVFYVYVDEGAGGELLLFDPRMPLLVMHAPRLRFKVTGGEREFRIKPVAGRLIVFPAWLAHEVQPWQGDGLRISIAVNLSHAKPPAPADGQ
jgi:uncharacterized protein (TIGR02466 family)